jgi:hypothetical protein
MQKFTCFIKHYSFIIKIKILLNDIHLKEIKNILI